MSHPLFGPEARDLLEKDDKAAMETFCETLHPATVAEALSDDFSVEDVWRFLHTTDIAHQAAIFAYFPLDWQVKMVEGTGRQQMARLIEEMSHDDRADLVRRLPPQVSEQILRLVDEADRRDIAALAKYPENTAGALMTTDYAWLPANMTVAEALDRLRVLAPDKETIYYVYVVDDQRKLLGAVSLRDLILASRRAVLSDIMEKQLVTARATDDREKVAQDLTHYDLLAIPVIDAEDRLVGIVTYDDVIDVVVSEATEDVHRMGAVGPITENYLEASFVKVWWNRAHWLAVLFGAELLTFSALSYFEDAIAEVVVLSLFIPLCISTGGNSGSQAATLITRAMALGQITTRDAFRVFRHELAMGIVLGLTLGLIGFARGYATPHAVRASSPPRPDEFTVTVPTDEPLSMRTESRRSILGVVGPAHDYVIVTLPSGEQQVITNEGKVEVELPEDTELPPPVRHGDRLVYTFPKKCSLPRPPVDRVRLGLVIALAVTFICLWGTIIGSMLPVIFKLIGADPGVASSPFVATFVDVTGIMIYFSIAKVVLWDLLM
jgi:magnesium transporter